MSAAAAKPPEQPRPRSKVAKNNRRQVLLYFLMTLILTGATVWAGRVLLKDSETLTFAVGNPNGDDARFATKLAAVLKNTNSRLRLKIVNNADNAKALAQFDRRGADLVVLRTDAKVPQRARALAILDHDLVLLFSPGSKKIKSVEDLKKQKKIAVLADSDSSASFIRSIFDFAEGGDAGSRLQVAPAGSTLDKLLASGFGAVIVVAHATQVMKDKSYEQYAKKGGFTLNAIDAAKALARKFPGISEETVETGMLSSSPEIPDDDLDTIGLQWLLIAQSKMTTTTAADLARVIYENKAELSLDDGFASKIEPATTDKDAFIIAHPGAAEYINDDIKTFMDRYSDMMYLGAGALSVIGSIFAAIYSQFTRVAPERASELATAILLIGEKIEHADSLDRLEELEDELERILRGAVIGLRDGTISSDGLDTFKLGYEFVRDEIGMRRHYLERHVADKQARGEGQDKAKDEAQDLAGDLAHDDNVSVVKAARSA
jgi:TRAP-type uncharacterized transport system substrate-binding protein